MARTPAEISADAKAQVAPLGSTVKAIQGGASGVVDKLVSVILGVQAAADLLVAGDHEGAMAKLAEAAASLRAYGVELHEIADTMSGTGDELAGALDALVLEIEGLTVPPEPTTHTHEGPTSLDGVDDRVDWGSFSVEGSEFYVKADFTMTGKDSDDDRIVTKSAGRLGPDHDWMFGVTGSRGVIVRLRTDTGYTSVVVDAAKVVDNQRTKLELALLSGSLHLLQDGTEVWSMAKTGKLVASNRPVTIGASPDASKGWSGHLQGTVHEVVVGNKVPDGLIVVEPEPDPEPEPEPEPDPDPLPEPNPNPQKASKVPHYQFSWAFVDASGQPQEHDVMQSATGDWLVKGPVRVGEILPKVSVSGGRTMHGSMVNPSPRGGSTQGYDSTTYGQYGPIYRSEMNVALGVSASNPLVLNPGDTLVSTQSHPTSGNRPQIQACAVLTVVNELPAPGSFRPQYCRGDKTIWFNKSQLDYSVLAKFDYTGISGTPTMASAARKFQRCRLDHVPGWLGREIHPIESMKAYGRDLSSETDVGALMLNGDYTDAEKEALAIGMVQLGIDLQGILDDGGGANWYHNGGHAQGRKFPILLAGVMLNDAKMRGIGDDQGVYFGEDDQTFYISQTDVNRGVGYTAAEIGTPEWGIRHRSEPQHDLGNWGGSYRRCCTANSWLGQVLAVRMMKAKALWKWDALFDYTDLYIAEQRRRGAALWTIDWTRGWVLAVWDKYRSAV